MSQTSDIEWTDATWNPVRGCTKVSPGCAHCYAETFAERFRGVPGHPYEQGFDLRLVPEKLEEPLRWKKPRRIFVNSMSDLFQDGVPTAFIDKAFAVMALASQHTFQVLTKRPERMRDYLQTTVTPNAYLRVRKLVDGDDGPNPIREAWWRTLSRFEQDSQQKQWWTNLKPDRWPLPNVWLGVSVENQRFADERIPLLLETPAAIRFVSYEPALGPVDFYSFLHVEQPGSSGDWKDGRLGWVIVGGESGPGARPFDPAWAYGALKQCRAAGVPVFVKQMGPHPIFGNVNGEPWTVKLKSKKGGDMSEWPSDLRVREFPR